MTTDENRPERNRWTRPGFIAAAGILALIAVAGISFLVFPPGHHKTAAPATGPATGTAKSASDSACGLPAGNQAEPTTPPAAQWALVGHIAAPSTTGIGPGKVVGGQRSCYAHSPTGALYAAANSLAVLGNSTTAAWGADQLVAVGPGRDKLIAATRSMTDFPPGTLQVQGFHLVSSSPDSAVIDLAFRQSIPSTPDVLGHFLLTLRWQAGDWKLVADPNGSTYYGKANLADLTGYILWSGV